ncbi:polar amino acid transport system substrate-binding protein [Labrenzia sp. MBR-25]|jgi:polar amino acid transport system substrate-binding protein
MPKLKALCPITTQATGAMTTPDQQPTSGRNRLAWFPSRVLAGFVGFVLALALQAATVSARDLVVLATPEEPYKFVQNGVSKGIDVEVLDEVMRRLGLSYSLAFVDSGTRIQQEARAGRADMLLLFSKKQDRMEYLVYPQESYIDISWSFFIRAEDAGSIHFENYNDLKGLQIGITQDFSYTPEFLASGLNFQTIASNKLQIGMLLAKRVDAVPMNTISTLYEEKKAGRLDKLATLPLPLITKPYYNVFAKASTFPEIESLPERYDATIREMQTDGTLDAILVKYLGRRPGGDHRGGS